MSTREKYRNLCRVEPTIPIFSRDWWLDACAGKEGWDVVVVERGEEIVAALPYILRRHWGWNILTQPALTQALGPWLRSSAAKYAKRLGKEKDLMFALIDALPRHQRYIQNWHHSQTNWLPFYWRGFRQTTRYTYRLPQLDDKEALWAGFQENIRTDIRKARSRIGLTVRQDCPVEDFIDLHAKTFSRQGMDMPDSVEIILRLDKACSEQKARQIFIAEDSQGRRHAGVYIVWDQNSAYYLMGGGDPELRNSGATSLCLWEAIQFASSVSKSFDFEGSMIEPIERFFRAFGAVQTPYYEVSKTLLSWLRIALCLRDITADR